MATTRARQKRRALQRAEETLIDNMLTEYTKDPNLALRKCITEFGRDRFENAMKIYLHNHVIQTALTLAIKHCITEKERI